MAEGGGTLLQTFFSRLGFEVDAKGLDNYESKLKGLSMSLLKFSGIASLSVAGLFELTRRSTEGLAEIEKLSETYQIATSTFAAFDRMGRQVGITAESMNESIVTLQKGIEAVSIGQGRFLTKILAKYRIDVKDATGKTKDLHTMLGDIAERMQGMTAGQQNLLAARLRVDPGMIRLLRNGREEFERLYATAKTGLPFKDEDYKKAEEFQIKFANAKAAVGALTASVGLQLMPMFERLLDKFLAWWKAKGEYVFSRLKYWLGLLMQVVGNVLDFIEDLTGDTDLLTTAMKALGVAIGIVVAYQLGSWAYGVATAIGSLVTSVRILAGAYEGVATAAETAAASELAAAWPVLLIVAGLAALIAIIALVIDDIMTWKKGGESLFGSFLKWLRSIGVPLDKIRDKWRETWTQIKAIWSDAWEAMKQALKDFAPELRFLWTVSKVIIGVMLVMLAAAIALAIALAVVIAAVLGAVIWLGAKLVSIASKVINFIFESPAETIRKLSAWFSAVSDWLGTKWHEFAQVFVDGFSKLATVIGDFFMGVVQWVIDEAIKLFTVGLSSLIEKFGGAALALWSKLTGASSEGAQAGVAKQRALSGMPPPALAGAGPGSASMASLSPTQQAAVTMATSASNVNAAQTNSNNTKVEAHINVQTPEQAAQTVMTLKDKAAKKRQTVGRNMQQTAL